MENLVDDVFVYFTIAVILGQNVFSAICPIGYRTSDNHIPRAVQLPIGWVVSGPMPNCKQLKESCWIFSTTDIDLDETDSSANFLSGQVCKRWELQSFSSLVNIQPRSKSDKHAWKFLTRLCLLDCSRFLVGIRWQVEDTKNY